MPLPEDERIYEAERSLHMMGFATRMSDPQAFLDHAVSTVWFRNRWKRHKLQTVEVKASTLIGAWTDFDRNTIYLPPWAFNSLTLLHELAHLVVGKHDHGPKFAAAHLALVRRFMGDEAGRRYRYALLTYGVEIGPRP